MNFADRLDLAIRSKGNPVCVGLDPRLDQLPKSLVEKALKQHGPTARAAAEALLEFNVAIIDAVADSVPVCKPQIAFYEEFGWEGLRAYEATVRHARSKGLLVISDAKRGDIGNTAQAYARAHLSGVKTARSADELQQLLKGERETLAGFDADALTVNPYMGRDTLEPFVKVCAAAERGLFVLVKTSNQGSGDLQDLAIGGPSGGTAVYEHVAKMVCEIGKGLKGQCGLSSIGAVVGATYPDQARRLRELMPDAYFLIPGFGAQGGTAADAAAGFRKDGRGAIVNNSRGLIFAYKEEAYAKTHGEADFAGAARQAALKMAAQLQQALSGQ